MGGFKFILHIVQAHVTTWRRLQKGYRFDDKVIVTGLQLIMIFLLDF